MDTLHELIASMTAAEKSYFKRYATKLSDAATDTNYIRLFDAIAEQKKYDEAALKKKFSDEKFVKQFSVAKKYLYKIIIKALRNFHEETNPAMQVKSLLHEADVLVEKGIYEYAYKVILKGAELTEELELFSDQREFLNKEIYLLMNHYKHENKNRTVDKVLDAQRQLNRKTQNLIEYESLYQKQHQIISVNYHLRTEKHLLDNNEIFLHPLLSSPDSALSSQASYYFHYIRTIYFSVVDKRVEFLEEAKKLTALCRSSKHFKKTDMRGYMNALNLLMEATYFNAQWELMEKALKELEELPVKSDRDTIARFIYYSRFGLIYFDTQKDTDAKHKLIEKAWTTVRKMEQKIPYHIRISIIVTYSSALMEMGEYAKALDWIEYYRQHKKEGDVRQDVQSILLMMQLIAHYELNNVLLVKNTIPNITRFIRSIGQQSRFEKVALSFLNKLTSSNEINDRIIKETIHDLNELKEGDILSRNRTMHDMFRIFIESKKHGNKYHQQAALATGY